MKFVHTLVAMIGLLVDPLVGLFRTAMRVCRAPATALPRVIRFAQHFQQERGYGKVIAGGRGFALAVLGMLAIVATVVAFSHLAAASALLAVATAAPPQPRDLKTVLAELKEVQEKFKGKVMTQAEGEKFEALAVEAEQMQAEHDRNLRIKLIERQEKYLRTVDDPILPEGDTKREFKPDDIVAYVSIGQAFVNSPLYKQAREQNFPQGFTGSAIFEDAAMLDAVAWDGLGSIKGGMVPITRKQVESSPQLKQIIERKAVPTVGAGVIRTQRDPELVRATEQAELAIRDLLNVSPTDSNSIEYVVLNSYTRAAAPVAESATKPESTLNIGTATAPVRTLAVHMPVTMQQLQDVAQLQNMIEGELRWDLKKKEEEQIAWGDGTGQNLLGIFLTPGVVAGRTVGGDTIIDLIRRMATDIRRDGLMPNGVAIDPLDWETVELTKATTNQYVYAVIREGPDSRIWGLRVVETVAMTEPGTFTTNERRVLVGDFRRGATLWDRMQAAVSIGWINDQFIKNQRTILDEERVAFGVKRPKAFKFRITQARVV